MKQYKTIHKTHSDQNMFIRHKSKPRSTPYDQLFTPFHCLHIAYILKMT